MTETRGSERTLASAPAMRIAYFTDTEQIGGAERHVADLAAAWRRRSRGHAPRAPGRRCSSSSARPAQRSRLRRAGDAGTTARTGCGVRRCSRAACRALRRRSASTAPTSCTSTTADTRIGLMPSGRDARRSAPCDDGQFDALGAGRSRRCRLSRTASSGRAVDAVVFPSMIVATPSSSVAGCPAASYDHLRYGVRAPELPAPMRCAAGWRPRASCSSDGSARAVPEKGYDVFVGRASAAPPACAGDRRSAPRRPWNDASPSAASPIGSSWPGASPR